MRSALLFLFAIVTVLAPVSAHASGATEAAAMGAWEELRAVIAAGDQNRARAFLGKQISLEGSRDRIAPELTLSVQLDDKSSVEIIVNQPRRASSSAWSIRRAQRLQAVGVTVRILGVIRVIDIKKRVIVLDPIYAEVTSST